MSYQVLIYAVYDVINFKIYLQATLKAMADSKKKRGRKIQKYEYLENEKSFLDEIKSVFHSFLKAIIWWKINSGHKLVCLLSTLNIFHTFF